MNVRFPRFLEILSYHKNVAETVLMQDFDNRNSPRSIMSGMFSPAMMMTVAAVQIEGGLAVLAIAIAWVFGIPLREMFVFETFSVLIALVATVPMLVFCRLVYLLPLKAVEFTRRFMQSVYRDFIRHCSVTQLSLVAIMSGIGEELLFRGVLQTSITNACGGGTWGLAAGIVITSVLFGIVHPINKLYVFLCFIFGIYLGLIFVWSGNNLIIPIIIHALYNFVIFLAMPRMVGFTPDVRNSDS